MNSVNLRRFRQSAIASILIYFTLTGSFLLAQEDSSRFAIGLNFTPLYTGTPEIQFDYMPRPRLAFSLQSGYSYKAKRGGMVMVEDFSEIYVLRGFYLKPGVKYITPKDASSTSYYLQLMYVFSYYYEEGATYYDNWYEFQVIEGIAHGAAIAMGMDIPVFKRCFIRGGCQLGIYRREEHLGRPVHTIQPGLGPYGLFLFNIQLIAGLGVLF